MSIFDFLHSFIDEVRPQRGGVAFQAPEPISNEEYQAYRQAEIAALEAKYDLSSVEGIMAIPRDASLHHGGGIHSYTGDIDYYLRNKGYGYEKAGNIKLAILCLKKSNEIRMFCRNGYRRDDYYSLVRMLALHGRVDEAQAEKDRIDRFFDSLKESGGIQSRRNKGGDESGSCPGFADGGQGYRPVHCKQRLCVVAVYHRRIQAPAAEHLAVPDGRAGASLTQEAVQVAVNAMARDKSPKYVKNAYGLLTAALSVYRPGLVLRTTLPQKEKPDISIPSTEDIQRIAQYEKGKRFELPFLLAAWLGLRASEIRGLTWDCVGDGTIHIKQALVDGPDGPVLKLTKTYSSDRVLPVPPYIMALIEAQPHTDEYIIHYDRHQLYKRIGSACNTLGIQRYRFHDPRHYQASVVLSMGVPDKYAMERMGHASTNMPKNVYQHTMSEKSRKVAASIDAFFEKNLTTGE